MKYLIACILILVAVCSTAFAAGPLSDGSVMITIPVGTFTMGSNYGDTEEKPVHKVYLDAYDIGKYEVTVAQYRKFCEATGRQMPEAPSWDWKDTHPIVNVTWDDANEYCKWAGGRLPTEAEWERAARGTNARIYPWGNKWDANKCANGWLGLTSTKPVGSYPAGASPYGCLDMAGNAWEYCSDWYGEDYYKMSPAKNPKGPLGGEYHVMRGGCFYSYMTGTRTTQRGNFFPSGSWYSGGFRIAR